MGRNVKRRKANREYQRGYSAGLEGRNPSGGIEYTSTASAAYRAGRQAGATARIAARQMREAVATA